MRLFEPLVLGTRSARNRIVFGPHETNLGRGRAISERHVAYYRRRAAGGAGLIVTEEASVHAGDWPYERCPLAEVCAPGWEAVAGAVHDEGALVVAAIGHSGGQGSSAYSQSELWAPSRVPEVNSREVPKSMEPADIAAVVGGFEAAAGTASAAGLDGVEVNAGQFSLVRQFLSGLTNQRDDEWGTDRLRFATEVLIATRRGAGPTALVGLRLSADELAPWAGIVPEAAAGIAAALAPLVDYITVVRGSIFTVSATQPDGHTEPGFNLALTRTIRDAVAGNVPVIAQGSIVDVSQAAAAVDRGDADAVEMTRAQIADPDLAAKAALGEVGRIRPCILCNQACQVRDARNPIISCVVEPGAGHETDDPPLEGQASVPRTVLVAGAGPAGLEAARVLAGRGHQVTVAERSARAGGMVRVASAGAGRSRLGLIADWLEAECAALGVTIDTNRDVTPADLEAADVAIIATGSRPGRRTYEVATGATVVDAADLLAGAPLPDGPVAVWDPIGGPIAPSVCELLRAAQRDVTLITPDLIAGNELSRSGDLAPANVRLLGAGVEIARRSILRLVDPDGVVVEDRFTGETRRVTTVALIDAGYRLPDDELWQAAGATAVRVGDAVAPRTLLEAILEGRRAALAVESAVAQGAPV